jgi:molybdopterin-guanine dinucleotide biosynthesis protein A
MRPIAALVLAGGPLERDRFPHASPAIAGKAQLPLLGRPLVEWTVAALRACPRIERIVVVGPESLATPTLAALDAAVCPEGGDIAANLWAGLWELREADRLLVLSGDLPLLTPGALDDLFTQAPVADVVFPYVEEVDIRAAFPERSWVFAHTPDGAFTGSSTLLCRPQALLAQFHWAETLLDARRQSPFRLAALFGPALALRYACRRLRVADVERRFSQLLHLSARGYRSPFPELALDVDKAADVALVEKALGVWALGVGPQALGLGRVLTG